MVCLRLTTLRGNLPPFCSMNSTRYITPANEQFCRQNTISVNHIYLKLKSLKGGDNVILKQIEQAICQQKHLTSNIKSSIWGTGAYIHMTQDTFRFLFLEEQVSFFGMKIKDIICHSHADKLRICLYILQGLKSQKYHIKILVFFKIIWFVSAYKLLMVSRMCDSRNNSY